ncbi:uncharacterized protein LOC133193475 [Saccostrea echinata]|uniref:uncharacterized protein LOC133193475 n=1 Tax=Saccostrea echinata TaxID=191078 RepID=UPI002A8143A5|nr:uncharacterized protein LOC133193475 [Saccostrea echinata]
MAFMPKVVAAVDFGGTCIGYCYTFLRENAKGLHFPEWGPHCSSKTKSCVLLSPDRQLHSLGNEADRKFLELLKSGESPAWFYCENIRNILTETKDYVTCRNRQSLDVTEILSGVLQFFFNHLFKRCEEAEETVLPADVRWVFNLPIRARRDIMIVLKSAASKANIDTETIYFISETEAIVVAAKILHQDRVIPETDNQLCVCDLGGSSVSVAKLDVEEEGTINMKEYEYTDNFGGQSLDKHFLKFLRNVLGSHVIQAFEDYLPLQMRELMSLFELSKSNMTPEFTRKFVFGIPPVLVKRFKVFFPTFQEEEQFAPNSKYGEKIIMSQSSLTADEKIVWPFLKEAVENVTEYLQHAFENLQIPKSTTVLVTGGFSKYWKLSDRMRRKFSTRSMLYIDAPAEAPLIGAVMVGREIEANKIFQSLPSEIRQMSGDEQDVLSTSLQRGRFAVRDVSINVIGHVGSEPKLLIRSFVMGQKRENKNVKEDLCILIGRRKHSVKKKNRLDSSFTTFMLPVPQNWKSLYMAGRPVINTQYSTASRWCTNESYRDIHKSHPQASPRQQEVTVGVSPEIYDQEVTPTPRPLDVEVAPTPRQLGVPHEKNVDQLYPLRIRELGSEYDVFQSRKSLLDWRPVYILIYSLALKTTDLVLESDNGPDSRKKTLLDFIIRWIEMIYMFTSRTKQGHPYIVVFGKHCNQQKETMHQSRSDIMIRQLDKYFSGTPVRNWLILDSLLRGDVGDERDTGLERLRQTIMDISNKYRTAELFPRHWITFYDRLMSKKREGHKVISSNLLRKFNTEHSEPLGALELEVFLKYHLTVGSLLDFPHNDHQDYVFLDPSVLSEEVRVIESIAQNNKRSKPASFKHVVIPNTVLAQYLASDRVNGKGQIIIRVLLELGILAKPVMYDYHGNLTDPEYLVLMDSLQNMNTSPLREKLFAEKKCITMRFRMKGCLPMAVFQRLLSSAVSLWSVVHYSAKYLMMANIAAFSLDHYHRLILATHGNTVDVYIYHKTASININPSVTQNVRHFLELNLRRILCVTSSVRQKTQFVQSTEDGIVHITTKNKDKNEIQVNEGIYIAELATCNSFTSCFATVDELQDKEEWKCERHAVGGESRDLLGVWYSTEEAFQDPVHSCICETDCKGLKEYLLSKTPSEQLIGRLARRLDPKGILSISQRLGLSQVEVRRVRDRTVGASLWRRSFNTLRAAILDQSLTLGQLQAAIIAEGVGEHILCQGLRVNHNTGYVPEEYLDRSVSRRELAAIGLNINRDIFPLAVELDISSQDIMSILQRPIERDPTLNIRDILLEWYLYSEFKPTFRVLVTAFIEVGLDLEYITNAFDQNTYNDLF